VAATAATRVGLIGLGAIGLGVLRHVREHAAGGFELVGAFVRDPSRQRPPGSPPLVASLADLLALRPDVVVECAGHAAFRASVPAALRGGCDVIAFAAGALADDALLVEVREAARAGGSRLRIPSGAIAGLDALAAASVGGLDRVTHTIRKPARALLPADEAAALREPRELYIGPAREGVVRFPESANVAAAVSLAGIGFDRTVMRVVADPHAGRNQHVVEAQGAFGALRVEVANIPSDENPRTGRLTAMSAFRALLDRREILRLG